MDKPKINVKEIAEWIICIIVAVVLALIVRTFVGTPTIVKMPSMYPTLEEGQRLILNKISLNFGKQLQRGDIITFESPTASLIVASEYDNNNPVAEYNYEPKGIIQKFMYYVLEINKTSYIKRVIATEGEHVTIKDNKVYINGKELKEDYLPEGTITTSLNGLFVDLTVPEGCVYVLGDNREHSTDSRRFGCIPMDKVEGVVLIRIFPFNKFGSV